MSRGTIKLPEEQYQKHNERRKELGLSWAEYIDGQAPDLADEIRPVVKDAVREALDN
jgi:hypothetical protein